MVPFGYKAPTPSGKTRHYNHLPPTSAGNGANCNSKAPHPAAKARQCAGKGMVPFVDALLCNANGNDACGEGSWRVERFRQIYVFAISTFIKNPAVSGRT